MGKDRGGRQETIFGTIGKFFYTAPVLKGYGAGLNISKIKIKQKRTKNMKIERRVFIGILIIGIIFAATVTTVNADGGLFIPPRPGYEDISQPSQKAIIIYDDGKEDLILQVRYEKGAENFAWVVPVPDYPEVNKSDSKLFDELYYLTTPPTPEAPGFRGEKAAVPPPVEVLERKRVGIYDVSILSATDPSALINWLNKNGYNFPENAENIIDFYIAKGWYFVALRIDLEAEKQDILNELKTLNPRINTSEDAKMYLPELVADDVARSKNYNESTLNKLATILEGEPREYRERYEKLYIMYWVEGHHSESEIYNVEYENIARALDDKFEEIEENLKQNLNKGTIQPIKFSFNSTQIIYPLKITSLNPGTTEVLLYVFADGETYIEDFSVEYAKWVYPKDVKDKKLRKIVIKEYFLTKLRKSFSQKEMVDDLVIKGRQITTPTIIKTPTPTPTDSDGDGWTDTQERIVGTNPYYVDTDGDGIWDPRDPNPLVKEKEDATPASTPLIPAFEAIFAIAGLFAVAYLLKRRK